MAYAQSILPTLIPLLLFNRNQKILEIVKTCRASKCSLNHLNVPYDDYLTAEYSLDHPVCVLSQSVNKETFETYC